MSFKKFQQGSFFCLKYVVNFPFLLYRDNGVYTISKAGDLLRFSYGSLCVFVCIHAKSLQSCLTLCDPMGCRAHQAPLSMGYSRQEYWSGLPCPSPGDLPEPWIELGSLVSCIGRWVLYHQHYLGSPYICVYVYICVCLCKYIM